VDRARLYAEARRQQRWSQAVAEVTRRLPIHRDVHLTIKEIPAISLMGKGAYLPV
jgi:hypothetical protein